MLHFFVYSLVELEECGWHPTCFPAADAWLGKNGIVDDGRQVVVDLAAQFGR